MAMRVFAASQEEQIAYLLRLHADHSLEALTEGWQSGAIPHYIAHGILAAEEAEAALAIDRILTDLERMHGWGLGTTETLSTDPEWATIRHLAADAVARHDARNVEWTDPAFLQCFAHLRRAVKRRIDPANHHDRWVVYRTVLEVRDLRPTLLSGLDRDPDPRLASAVLVDLLEVSPATDRASIVAAVPSLHTDFVRRRVVELTLLERFRDDPDGTPPAPMTTAESEQILVASNWFQTRMIAEATALDTLKLLAERGPSRRIRLSALERLQQIEERPLLSRFTDPGDTREATLREIEHLITASADLQRRVATESRAANALEALAKHGRTHRIRGYARDRLHRLERTG